MSNNHSFLLLDQLNTTVHGTMKTTPYELVFGQPPRHNLFPGVNCTKILEENVEDLFCEDEESKDVGNDPKSTGKVVLVEAHKDIDENETDVIISDNDENKQSTVLVTDANDEDTKVIPMSDNDEHKKLASTEKHKAIREQADTVSNIGAPEGTVNVYDSLYSSVNTHVKKQIARIIQSAKPVVTLNFVNVQTQTGTCDCGIFVLAFATCLVNGISPESLVFDQSKMRNHLYQCMQRQEITNFPLQKGGKNIRRQNKSVDSMTLSCKCRMPDNEQMVECTLCKNWYHILCVNVPTDALNNDDTPWYCDMCEN